MNKEIVRAICLEGDNVSCVGAVKNGEKIELRYERYLPNNQLLFSDPREGVCLVMPSQTRFTRTIRVPKESNSRKTDEAIRKQASDHIPFPLTDVKWDYKITEDGEKDVRVRILAFTNENISKEAEKLKRMRCRPSSVTSPEEALSNIINDGFVVYERGKNEAGLYVINKNNIYAADFSVKNEREITGLVLEGIIRYKSTQLELKGGTRVEDIGPMYFLSGGDSEKRHHYQLGAIFDSKELEYNNFKGKKLEEYLALGAALGEFSERSISIPIAETK
ncbi:MAG TPA: hypothetical protein VJK51_00580 [Candidatus Nanoarchaeia archaeon]|nr:hypothetical protein [Candidatus Nanoarchaeia archaeon]